MQLQKTSALRNLFIFKTPLLCANHFFLIIQLSEVETQQSSELIELL